MVALRVFEGVLAGRSRSRSRSIATLDLAGIATLELAGFTEE
jgi:hypothetical protein